MKITRYSLIILMTILTSFFFSACNKVDTLEEYYEQEGITPQKTANGLEYTIHSPGEDTKITDADFIQFDFSEMNVEGKPGASSKNGIGLPVGYQVSELISWLRDGLSVIGVGGDVTLYVSPKLIYRVKVLQKFSSVEEYNKSLFMDYFAANNLSPTATTEGLYYVIDTSGNGRFPSGTSRVTVNYKGYFLNGKQFDSSYDRGEAAMFSLQQVISGWTQGIPYFDEGSKGTLFIPSQLAYGKNGNSSIPANSPLIFDIELIDF